MLSDGVIPLIESGVINNRKKKLNVGRSVTSFINGTRKLFDFVDDNPEIGVMDIAYVNDTSIIRQNPKVTAINSAIEIDLTGQVCADSMGTYQYSGIGGHFTDRAFFKRGCRGGDDPRACALGGDRIWKGGLVWKEFETAGTSIGRDCAPEAPGMVRKGVL